MLAKIGAGCGPDCMNSAVIRIVRAAPTATTAAMESRGRSRIHRSGSASSALRQDEASSFNRADADEVGHVLLTVRVRGHVHQVEVDRAAARAVGR